MVYTENQYKELEEKIKKLEKENQLKNKEIKLLKVQNKEKDEIIHDLDANNYKEKYNVAFSNYESLLKINKEQNIKIDELKKKVEELSKQQGN